jgi:hypothetical protein
MFHLLIERPLLRYSHATLRERRTVRCTLTHLPTGRQWFYATRKAAMAARSALTAAVAAGTLSILPPEPLDAEPVAAAA